MTENLGPTCHKCHEKGHIAVDCPVVICQSCGERDDHLSNQCPKATRCTNCGDFGHIRADCTRKMKMIYCHRCDSKTHTASTCPKIWRRYKYKSGCKPSMPETIFCYNCASEGHYGDDCDLRHRSTGYFKQASAFSSRNLNPSLAKRLERRANERSRPDSRRRRHNSPPRRRYESPPRRRHGSPPKAPRNKLPPIPSKKKNKKSLGQRINDYSKRVMKR